MAKKILITGLHSYIGNAVEEYLLQYNQKKGEKLYDISKVSLRDSLEKIDFSGFDTVLHVAGIAHADVGKASEEEQKRYYAVNCDLAVETAKKARKQGVKQFIYMSSVIVYGDSARVGEKKLITKDTPLSPANFYGDSKKRGEEELEKLATDTFFTAIVRPPMVYGKGSKGNYPLLCKLANALPVFPKVENERSMIYIENLAEFIRLLTEDGKGGVFLPQNGEYVNTSRMVKAIRACKGKSMALLSIGSPFVFLLSRCPGKVGKLVNKAFGSLTVDASFGDERIRDYNIYSLEESIRRIHEA